MQSPRHCINKKCDAGWLDIAQFADKARADEVAAEYAAERVAVMREP